MLPAIYKEVGEHMDKSVESVRKEFSAVRTGKATASLLDAIKVEAYDTVMPLNQVATISAPEARLLTVQVFDKATVGAVVKGIQKADLGFNPQVDGQLIRIPVPALNEERRKELVTHCKHVAEEGRIALRNIRREANDRIKTAQKEKQISEDQEADGHDEVQKIIDAKSKEIDAILAQKEKELMEV